MSDDVMARTFRVREARRAGIRAVPSDPGLEFPVVPFACHQRPRRCAECQVECPYIPCPRGQP